MKIGYACQTIGIPGTNFKSCTMKNAREETLMSIISQNLDALNTIIDYNIANHIHLFRITSDLIPFGSSPVSTLSWWKIFEQRLSCIGKKIMESGMRISMHPGQYTVLNSPDKLIVERAVKDLEYHTRLLEALDPSQKNKIILHIGGAYGNKEIAIHRFVENYHSLDATIRKHLVIENDDKIYHIGDVMKISMLTGAPVVFDVLHHKVNPGSEGNDIYYWISKSRETWKPEDGVQKIHYSEQDPLKKTGSHSQTISLMTFQEFSNGLGEMNPDIMLEVKDKNRSAVKCINLTAENRSILYLEQEWARYKYLILEKSHEDYIKIRQILKDKKDYPIVEFYKLIDHAMLMDFSQGGVINAADHIWGYFKNCAEEKEKKRYATLLKNYKPGTLAHKKFLWQMTIKYQEPYLMQSYYFELVCNGN
ncbi:MAG: UV DNA damage repair endonuclease UvsE [Lachnospiraceae bacterium]|nr:UV DNA damage repair endonuclease UvsE [Lachnospiraceae bacterium]